MHIFGSNSIPVHHIINEPYNSILLFLPTLFCVAGIYFTSASFKFTVYSYCCLKLSFMLFNNKKLRILLYFLCICLFQHVLYHLTCTQWTPFKVLCHLAFLARGSSNPSVLGFSSAVKRHCGHGNS